MRSNCRPFWEGFDIMDTAEIEWLRILFVMTGNVRIDSLEKTKRLRKQRGRSWKENLQSVHSSKLSYTYAHIQAM